MPGMCGRHSKDQCVPAGLVNVERVTEVVARPGRAPIPALCVSAATLVALLHNTIPNTVPKLRSRFIRNVRITASVRKTLSSAPP